MNENPSDDFHSQNLSSNQTHGLELIMTPLIVTYLSQMKGIDTRSFYMSGDY